MEGPSLEYILSYILCLRRRDAIFSLRWKRAAVITCTNGHCSLNEDCDLQIYRNIFIVFIHGELHAVSYIEAHASPRKSASHWQERTSILPALGQNCITEYGFLVIPFHPPGLFVLVPVQTITGRTNSPHLLDVDIGNEEVKREGFYSNHSGPSGQ